MTAGTDYRAERRADHAAEAEQRRLDAAAADARRAERERAADQRAARLREERRAEGAREREDRAAARAARRRARAGQLTPENVYRRGTLALVVASGLASLPAQVLHFVHISPMLLPLPFALEGAAWVMAAGVAYADARGLPGWVRWLLRGLVLAAAGFAASVNYSYGIHLEGLSSSDAQAAGVGLAAVTLFGPLLFEVRQWVSTLAARDGTDRAARRHAAARRRHHRQVHRLAVRLVSAAPHGTLTAEDAWAHAWEVVHGPTAPGMTPDLVHRARKSATRLAEARTPGPDEIGQRVRAGLGPEPFVLPPLADVVPIRTVKPQVTSQMPPKAEGKKPRPPRRRKGDTPTYHRAARTAAADTARRTPA
ncbi:hypothetical protein JNUCC64_09565 [Streptomyces sp. JNUCC 64]